MEYVDLGIGKRIFGDDHTAKSLMHEFIKTLPTALAQIKAAIGSKNYRELHEQVHKLRGACCYASTPKLLKAIEALDKCTHTLRDINVIADYDHKNALKLTAALETIAKATITHIRDNYQS